MAPKLEVNGLARFTSLDKLLNALLQSDDKKGALFFLILPLNCCSLGSTDQKIQWQLVSALIFSQKLTLMIFWVSLVLSAIYWQLLTIMGNALIHWRCLFFSLRIWITLSAHQKITIWELHQSSGWFKIATFEMCFLPKPNHQNFLASSKILLG